MQDNVNCQLHTRDYNPMVGQRVDQRLSGHEFVVTQRLFYRRASSAKCGENQCHKKHPKKDPRRPIVNHAEEPQPVDESSQQDTHSGHDARAQWGGRRAGHNLGGGITVQCNIPRILLRPKHSVLWRHLVDEFVKRQNDEHQQEAQKEKPSWPRSVQTNPEHLNTAAPDAKDSNR